MFIDPTFFGIFICGPLQSFVVQLHLQFVKIPTILSWFRRQFVESKFWLRETGAARWASDGYRWLQLSNRRGRSRITWPGNLDFSFQVFKVSLPYHLVEDVFNNGFWKLCIAITNDLEPAGLNLLEQFHTYMLFDGLLMILSVLITISVSVKFQFVK